MRGSAQAALIVIAIVTVVGFFLSLEPDGSRVAPAGVDTPWYVWRGKLVSAEGLEALSDSALPPYRAQPFRAGFPLLTAFLGTTINLSPLDLAFIAPALLATVIGLSAGGLAIRILREPLWAFPLYAVGVAASPNVVLISISHLDNLMVTALLVAGAVAVFAAMDGDRTILAACILLTAAALTHWSFTALFCAMVLALAVLLLPASIRDRREGVPLFATPSARLGLSVGGAAALAATVFSFGGAWPELPASGTRNVMPKLRRDLPGFLLPLAAAGGGVAALLARRDRTRRRALLLLAIWALSALLAIGLAWLGVSIAAHRFLHFAVAIPFLAVAAVVGLGRALTALRPRGLGATLAGALLLGSTALALWASHGSWRPLPQPHVTLAEQAALAAGYVEQLKGMPPVIYTVNPRTARQPLSTIRAVVPIDQIRRSHLFVGDVADLLADRWTERQDDPTFTRISRAHWEGARHLLNSAVVISLDAFDAPRYGPEGIELGSGVTLVRGPPPDGAIRGIDRPDPPSTRRLALSTIAALGVIAAIGFGWTTVLLPGPWIVQAALAPAVGATLLVITGMAGAQVGLDLPPARPWVVVGLFVLGWAASVAAWLGRRWRAELSRGDCHNGQPDAGDDESQRPSTCPE